MARLASVLTCDCAGTHPAVGGLSFLGRIDCPFQLAERIHGRKSFDLCSKLAYPSFSACLSPHLAALMGAIIVTIKKADHYLRIEPAYRIDIDGYCPGRMSAAFVPILSRNKI